ncbi:YbaB/EbfC family nucleoid-associated protein [Streptomyces sp. NPDC002573]|uniref:YbaB/EbfC family nucleoid-associated protein n=1 Tax=Streptomyces sp. NPDC002573 TaxID=3364651 RepID=UPI0036B83E97
MEPFAGLDLEEIQQQFENRLADFTSLHSRIQSIWASATSPRHLLTATVSAQGDVTHLKFHTDAYRAMAPSELESVVLETIQRARRDALDRMKELVAPLAPAGMSIDDVLAGRFDVKDIMSGQPFAKGDAWSSIAVAADSEDEDD